MGLFKDWAKAIPIGKLPANERTTETGSEFYSMLSDPSLKIKSNDFVTGGDGNRIAYNRNPNLAKIQQADEQRLELQKKTGKRGSSILGGGLY